ncbi:MAG: cupin domain-containing protein [bacterium]|nr:cupin domain-containing protein [bacterium]
MEDQKSRKPFKKSLAEIPTEEAHGGSGKRQLILSKEDPISNHLHAMTKGFLVANGLFDWHSHKDIDEFFLVIKGSGVIEFEDGTKMEYGNENLIYIPSNLSHKITASKESEFFFIRLGS